MVDAIFHPGRANFRIPDGGFTSDLDGSLDVLVRNHSATQFNGRAVDFKLSDTDALPFFPRWDDHLTGLNDTLATIANHPLTGTLSPGGDLLVDLPFNIGRSALNAAIDTSILPFFHPDEGLFLDPTGRGTLSFISPTGQQTNAPFRARGISAPQNVTAPGTAIALVAGVFLLLGFRWGQQRSPELELA